MNLEKSEAIGFLKVCFKHAKQMYLLKMGLIVLVITMIFVPYLLIQKLSIFEITIIPETTVDRLIPFNDGFIWVYNTLSLFAIIVTFQFTEKRELLKYVGGILVISIASMLIFVFFPTECPRPPLEGTTEFYQYFITLDKPSNALPSLHISVVLYTMLTVVINVEMNRAFKVILGVWCAVIIYSTLATKQHLMLDVYAGVLLAVLVFFANLRWVR